MIIFSLSVYEASYNVV